MGAGDVNVYFDIHDSEIERVGHVLAALKEKQGKSVNMEAFRKEIIGRFEDINIKSEVRVYETNESSVFWFEVDLIDRLSGEFDPDRQVHEVTNDILGLGEKGVIKTGGLQMLQGGGGHSHGHGHHHH